MCYIVLEIWSQRFFLRVFFIDSFLRSGNIVAAVVPKKFGGNGRLERVLIVAYVTSIWKSNKQPKLVTTAAPLAQIVALRVTEMTPMAVNVASYKAMEDATAWVLKPESVLAVLTPAPQDDAVRLEVDQIVVQISGDSVAIVDSLASAPQWWPILEEDDKAEENKPVAAAAAGLFLTARRKRNKKGCKQQPEDAQEKESNGKKGVKKGPFIKKFLKKAKKDTEVAYEASNFRRNGKGPVLVSQTMQKMKCLEEDKLPSARAQPCFDDDGQCIIDHTACKGCTWDKVSKNAHPFLCAEWPVSELYCNILGSSFVPGPRVAFSRYTCSSSNLIASNFLVIVLVPECSFSEGQSRRADEFNIL